MDWIIALTSQMLCLHYRIEKCKPIFFNVEEIIFSPQMSFIKHEKKTSRCIQHGLDGCPR